MSKVTVNPTPSQSKNATPTTSAQTITPDSGNLLNSVSIAAMPTGVLGAISATKSVSGNIATVTPVMATGTAGYNEMAAQTGTAVTVSASEVCNSGTLTCSTNGTFACTGYGSVTVAIPEYTSLV